MNFKEYQEQSQRTMGIHTLFSLAASNYTIGLSGEVGEVCEIVKKHLFHGKEFDKASLKKEIGDVLWYLSAIASVYGVDLDEAATLNLEKLLARYPDGFDKDRSSFKEGMAE